MLVLNGNVAMVLVSNLLEFVCTSAEKSADDTILHSLEVTEGGHNDELFLKKNGLLALNKKETDWSIYNLP